MNTVNRWFMLFALLFALLSVSVALAQEDVTPTEAVAIITSDVDTSGVGVVSEPTTDPTQTWLAQIQFSQVITIGSFALLAVALFAVYNSVPNSVVKSVAKPLADFALKQAVTLGDAYVKVTPYSADDEGWEWVKQRYLLKVADNGYTLEPKTPTMKEVSKTLYSDN